MPLAIAADEGFARFLMPHIALVLCHTCIYLHVIMLCVCIYYIECNPSASLGAVAGIVLIAVITVWKLLIMDSQSKQMV